MPAKVNKNDEEWRSELSPEQYEVLRQKGTERPGSHPYNDEKAQGTYRCAGCGAELFASDAKFESGTGWPSFFEPIAAHAVALKMDHMYGMERTEVTCARCGGHLGHVFDDGPRPTGQRYCMNSAALALEPASN